MILGRKTGREEYAMFVRKNIADVSHATGSAKTRSRSWKLMAFLGFCCEDDEEEGECW